MSTNQQIHRGDIFWYVPPKIETSSIQRKMRPVVIISNDACNEYSPIISGRYTTTKEKRYLPTHVSFIMNGYENIVLCEQEVAVVKNRLESYIATVDSFTMHQIERAILIQQGINIMDHVKLIDNSPVCIENYQNISDKKLIDFCEFREKFGARLTCMEYNIDIQSVDRYYRNICQKIGRPICIGSVNWKQYISDITNP